MMAFVRNPFSKKIFEKIINRDIIDNILNYSEVSVDENWEKHISPDYFPISDISQYAHAKNKNLVSFKDLGIAEKLLSEVKNIYSHYDVRVSGHFYYPPTGFMGWHTNHDQPGYRLYITYSSETNKSFFRYRNRGEKQIMTDYDDKGITIREFLVPYKKPYFWHCVGSECNRISFGFCLTKKL
tara:strand:+ start:405 stop:953 length:549 start_codon:yes stop_codon:yes gene_type:complete